MATRIKAGISLVTTKSELNKVFSQFIKTTNVSILDCLIALGDELVERAKASGQYNNVTGNLRSSVGYVIAEKGQVVRSSFKSGRRAGAAAGRLLAQTIAAQFANEDFVLVVVAGMNYATAVEARGKDVLTSTQIYANSRIPEMLKQLVA